MSTEADLLRDTLGRAEAAEAREATLRAEVERLRAVLADYENRITWDTTCGQCARTLDHAIRDYNRAETAEAREAALRARIEALADKLERFAASIGDESLPEVAWHRKHAREVRALASPAVDATQAGAANVDWSDEYGVPAPVADPSGEGDR